MKRLILLVICALALSGCSVTRTFTMELQGKNIKAKFGGYIPVEGEDVKITVTKTLNIDGRARAKDEDN